MKRNIAFAGIFVIAVIATFVIANNNNRNTDLANQDNFIRTIELPSTISRIAVMSGVGDSGGNGNHSTLRSVMLVRTELTKDNLQEIFVDLGFNYVGMYLHLRNWNYPEFLIRQATNYQFRSPRSFLLEFEELKSIDDFTNYYFIEFIK